MVNSLIALIVGIIVGGAGLLGLHELHPAEPTPNRVKNSIDVPPTPLPVGGSLAIETPVALFETTLANGITSAATTMTLTSATTKDGTTLASSTYSFIIDEGTASEEFVKADCTGTSCTNMTRGISVLTGTSTVAALAKSHRRGVSVKNTTAPIIPNIVRILSGIGTFPNLLSYTSGTACSGSSANSVLCDKAYIDGVAVAGASNANETTKGIIELATRLEMGSSTSLGSTGASLVLQSQYSTSSPGVLCGVCVVLTDGDGKINQPFLNLSDPFTFTSTTTLSAGVSIAASNASTTPLVLNGLPYQVPASRGASSTVLTENGWGHLVWQTPDWRILVSTTTTTGAPATTTIPNIPAATDLRIVIETTGVTVNSQLRLQFNGDTANNYAGNLLTSGGTSINYGSQSTMTLTQIDAGSTEYYNAVVNVTNTATKPKLISSQTTGGISAANSSGNTAWGTWFNTSSQISSIQLGCGSAGCPVGTRITVYGSNF